MIATQPTTARAAPAVPPALLLIAALHTTPVTTIMIAIK